MKDVLVVSEDPASMHRAYEQLKEAGVRVTGCLGPANTVCSLDQLGTCPQAEHCRITIVESPRSGAFVHEWSTIGAGTYAERLAARVPSTYVILTGVTPTAGASGTVAHTLDLDDALALVKSIVETERQPA